MSIAREWVAKHVPAEEDARKNGTSIARQQLGVGGQTLSTILAVFRGVRAKWL
jgi:hypothetical protein